MGIYENILWKEHALTYTLAHGERFAFRTANLPSPLLLVPAIFGQKYFTLPQTLTLARAMPAIVFGSEKYYQEQDKITYEEWHLQHGISPKMLTKRFLPMALALKFLPPAELSAKVVLDVSGMFLREDRASRIGFWPFGMIAQFIYFLGNTLCPLPQQTVYLGGYSTAVCPLCYGALPGLTAVLLSFPSLPPLRHFWERIAWPLQLLLITCALLPWLSQYVLNKAGWVLTPHWMMYLLGLTGGLAVGLLTYLVAGRNPLEA